MAEAKRKLAAILCADVAGYSRLMGDDERATMDTLNAYRDVFREHVSDRGGRVVDTAGDSVLSVFDSVVEAVHCAADVQGELGRRNADLPQDRRMAFRIGVNLGDIFEQDDGTVYGDGVNVAARLESLAEPGGVCLSGSAHEQVEGKTDLGFENIGEHEVKNIARPVRAYRVIAEAAAMTATEAPPAAPDKPSIAVLPFTNMSGDPEQEYFADGISEDLITDLSKISGLFVIARNSSFAFKGQTVDVKQVARELGVRHILEGSVRKAGGKVRINAQLIDATTGGHIWAERYDRDFDDIFALQDEITAEIVSALKVNLTAADTASVGHKLTNNVDAYEVFLRGRTQFYQFTPETHAEAERLFEQAILLDPNFAAAIAFLGFVYQNDWLFLWPGHADGLGRALKATEKAVAVDDGLGLAHAYLGWVQAWLRRHDQAIESFERALAVDPNNAEICAYFAEVLNYAGYPDRSIEMTEKALRFDPLIPANCAFHLGHSYYLLRRHDEAIHIIRGAIERVPSFPVAHMILAIVYSELDRDDDAAAEVETVRRLVPDYTLENVSRIYPYRTQEARERFIGGLRKAGLPE